MDLVYILGSGSRWGDNEIRYSIRSAVKNFPFRKIFVIGERPDWLDNVEHIFVADSYPSKIQNSITKQLTAAKQKGLSENYILMNDDFFFLKPLEELPVYYKDTAKAAINRHRQKTGYYYEAMVRTQNKLDMMGVKNIKDYSIHCPIVMNKTNVISMLATLGSMANKYLLRTCYGNIFNIGGKKTQDFKANTWPELQQQLDRDAEFLSINDAMVATSEFRAWIKQQFPEVSKYENDEGEGVKAPPGASNKYRAYHATIAFSYAGKDFHKGQLIDMATMKTLKYKNRLKHLWILK